VWAMSKYGEFDVVRTERRTPPKTTDSNVDKDGMREYSFIKCPHCNKNDIEIVSSNMDKQKYTVIREHIIVCPSFSGERPVKRSKTTLETRDKELELLQKKHDTELELQQKAYDKQLELQQKKHDTELESLQKAHDKEFEEYEEEVDQQFKEYALRMRTARRKWEELIAHSDQNYTSLLAEFRWLAKFVRKTTEAVEVGDA